MDKATAIAKLWAHGELSWKLKPCQQSMLSAIKANSRFTYVIKCARRLGKSYLLCTLAVMVCLMKPGAQVRYAAPTAKALRSIVRPIMNKIMRDCPKHLRPQFRSQDNMYVFPNGKMNPRDPFDGGSVIQLAGVNGGHADDLRGTECDLFLVDEARDIDELHYLVHDVAMPQFLDVDGTVVKGRRLIVASSPAKSHSHEFSTMAEEAKQGGYYSHYDIFAGGYSRDTIRLFFIEDGLPEEDVDALMEGRVQDIRSTTVLREYLALDVIDADAAIVPEWKDIYVREREPTEFDQFYHRYLFMDIGIQRDLTVVQFGLYDFMKAKLVIEDEVVIKGPNVTTPMIAKAIFEKTGAPPNLSDEAKKFLDRVGFKDPGPAAERRDYREAYRRTADNSHPLLLNDLSAYYDLHFTATTKDRLNEMVSLLRSWVKVGDIEMNPRCRHTIGSIGSGVWNKQRDKFDHSRVYGHYDGVAALVYGVRAIDRQTNPIPAGYRIDKLNTYTLHPPKRFSQAAKSLIEAFGLNPRR